jgi:hypothetical protein
MAMFANTMSAEVHTPMGITTLLRIFHGTFGTFSASGVRAQARVMKYFIIMCIVVMMIGKWKPVCHCCSSHLLYSVNDRDIAYHKNDRDSTCKACIAFSACLSFHPNLNPKNCTIRRLP